MDDKAIHVFFLNVIHNDRELQQLFPDHVKGGWMRLASFFFFGRLLTIPDPSGLKKAGKAFPDLSCPSPKEGYFEK